MGGAWGKGCDCFHNNIFCFCFFFFFTKWIIILALHKGLSESKHLPPPPNKYHYTTSSWSTFLHLQVSLVSKNNPVCFSFGPPQKPSGAQGTRWSSHESAYFYRFSPLNNLDFQKPKPGFVYHSVSTKYLRKWILKNYIDMSEDNNYSFRQPNQQIKTTAKPTNKKIQSNK